MNPLIEYTVFAGLVTACRFSTCPTRRSSVFVMATTEGVVRPPSWLGITTGSPPCITATTEFVVPRSIPIILLIAAIPPETFLPFLLARIPLKARRIQLGSCVPSPARGRVYMLSVCLSSFLITIVNCLNSATYRPGWALLPERRRFLLTFDTFSVRIPLDNWDAAQEMRHPRARLSRPQFSFCCAYLFCNAPFRAHPSASTL